MIKSFCVMLVAVFMSGFEVIEREVASEGPAFSGHRKQLKTQSE